MMNIEVGVRTLYWQSYAPPLGIAGLENGALSLVHLYMDQLSKVLLKPSGTSAQ